MPTDWKSIEKYRSDNESCMIGHAPTQAKVHGYRTDGEWRRMWDNVLIPWEPTHYMPILALPNKP